MKIQMDFGDLVLKATLFDTVVAQKFADVLPCTIELTAWGQEVYGSIDVNLGVDTPQPTIPEGGIAYSTNGNYICVFFGQTPAWSVEYLGQIDADTWMALNNTNGLKSVRITRE